MFDTLIQRLRSIEHPVLLILLVGIALRLILAPLTTTYDSDYWAIVLRNIDSGFSLYELEGYYYTPVWGYILGLIGAIQTFLLDLGETIIRISGLFFVEEHGFFSAAIASPSLLLMIKIPLFVCDFITAYLVMMMVREATNDDGKSALAFGLAFLSPVVLMSTGVIAMPDTVSTMFLVMTFYLLRKGNNFVAGMTFCMGALIKFFPAFMIFILVAYIIATNKGNRSSTVKGIVSSSLGSALVLVLIFLPQILEGDITQCFQFLFDRSGVGIDNTIFETIAGYLRLGTYSLLVLMSLLLGYRLSRTTSVDPFNVLMRYGLIIATTLMIYPPTTQYIVLLIPFLSYWIVVSDRRLLRSWGWMGLGALILNLLSYNALLLMPMAIWWGTFDLDSLIGVFSSTLVPILGGVTLSDVFYILGGALQCLGILSIPWIMYGDRILEKVKGYRSQSD